MDPSSGNRKVLILPLFSMPSGHQHVAEALRSHIECIAPNTTIRKMDILGSRFPLLEQWISRFYMRWIAIHPSSYQTIYQFLVKSKHAPQRFFKLYEIVFNNHLLQHIRNEQPDLIFCTHSLPSYLCGKLHENGALSIPVINVYTDYQLHHLWSLHGISLHFAPDKKFAHELKSRGVAEQQIICTGIPLHRGMIQKKRDHSTDNPPLVLISAGHAGSEQLMPLIARLGARGNFRYLILCGKNEALKKTLEQQCIPHVDVRPYIHDKNEIMMLYQSACAMITKAGGVTLSESIRNHLPTFVYHALPGQEQYNIQHLFNQNMLRSLNEEQTLEQQMLDFFRDKQQVLRYENHLKQYNSQFTIADNQVDRLEDALSQLLHPSVANDKKTNKKITSR